MRQRNARNSTADERRWHKVSKWLNFCNGLSGPNLQIVANDRKHAETAWCVLKMTATHCIIATIISGGSRNFEEGAEYNVSAPRLFAHIFSVSRLLFTYKIHISFHTWKGDLLKKLCSHWGGGTTDPPLNPLSSSYRTWRKIWCGVRITA